MIAVNHFFVALTPTYWGVVIGLLIGGLGIGLFPPNGNVWLGSVTPPAWRGRAVGGITSMVFLGQFFSPILTQPLVSKFGLASTFNVAGGTALLGALIFMWAARRQTGTSTTDVSASQP